MKPTHTLPLAATLSTVLALLSGTLGAQKNKPPQEKQKPTWPGITEKQRTAGEKWLKLLRSKKDEVRLKAVDHLTVIGPGFADRMLRSMKDRKNHNVNEPLVEILDRILAPAHAKALALHAGHKSTFARRYVLKTLARFEQKDTIATFEKARKDKDKEVAYFAAIGLVKTKQDFDALDAVFRRCCDEWGDIGAEVTRFFQSERSEAFVPWFRKKLKDGDTHEQVTVMRLMRSLAPKRCKRLIGPFLDSEHSILKKETINTLRVIVDGKDPLPLKKITVFRVIQMAKDWKKRI